MNGLVAEDVVYGYRRGQPVLRGVAAHFAPGRITALLGNNGSGKTTLIRILAGVEPPQGGQVLWNGRPLVGDGLRTYKRRLGYMPERLALDPEWRVGDALQYLAQLKGADRAGIGVILERVGLGPHAGKRVRQLSKGMRQRLNLAQALLADPEIVIFDEPANGFDVSGIATFYRILRELADRGAVVLFSSHQLTEVLAHGDELVLLREGRVARAGRLAEVVPIATEGPRRTWIELDRAPRPGELGRFAAELTVDADRALVEGVLTPERLAELLALLRGQGLRIRGLRIAERDLVELFSEVAR